MVVGSRKELQQLGSIGLQCWPRDRVITLLKVAGWSSASHQNLEDQSVTRVVTLVTQRRSPVINLSGP